MACDCQAGPDEQLTDWCEARAMTGNLSDRLELSSNALASTTMQTGCTWLREVVRMTLELSESRIRPARPAPSHLATAGSTVPNWALKEHS